MVHGDGLHTGVKKKKFPRALSDIDSATINTYPLNVYSVELHEKERSGILCSVH